MLSRSSRLPATVSILVSAYIMVRNIIDDPASDRVITTSLVRFFVPFLSSFVTTSLFQ